MSTKLAALAVLWSTKWIFRYNGLKWSQLSFLDNEVKEKAKWLSTPMINISKLNTSEALGFRNDLEAIQTVIDGEDGASIFLLCYLEMGPDLLLVTKQNRIYYMVFALKFYTNTIAKNVTDKNLRTSNLASVYHNKFGKANSRRKEEHKQFHKLFNDELIDYMIHQELIQKNGKYFNINLILRK
jgi:hypothetical protein